jgi:anthranilate phosphoribosyltransferase
VRWPVGALLLFQPLRLLLMQEQHPFSKFIAILARGKTKQRHLTLDEARDAMAMLVKGQTEPEQTGAFLMLQRLMEETSEEIAGFTLGSRQAMRFGDDMMRADIDWSSYAGKKRQLPWFILSALLLAENGYKVFMHGTEGHTPGRVYTRECLGALGVGVAGSYEQAASQLEAGNFAYMPLEVISETLRQMINLRPILGLRSPVHSFTRMLNPFGAPVMINGIFHRGFMDIHAGAAVLLEQPHMCVFRGDGGEPERRPGKTCEVWSVHGGTISKERWPAILDDPRQAPDENMNIADLPAVWKGDRQSDYGEAAICGTLAIALRTMGLTTSMDDAQAKAVGMWETRNKTLIPASA